MNWHKTFYKIGFLNIGYANKMLTPWHRILQPFAMILDGVLGVILLPTSLVPRFENMVLHRMIKAQMRKRIAKINKNKKYEK